MTFESIIMQLNEIWGHACCSMPLSSNGVIYEVFCFKSVHEHINQTMKSDELVCTATEFFNIWKQRKDFESKDSFYGNISFVR